MLKTFKHLIVIFFLLSFFPNKAISKENFCLDKEGFIYPIFEEIKCNSESEELITKSEFLYLIELGDNLRFAKLEDLRKNPEIQKKVKQENSIETDVSKKKELTSAEKRKLALQQKKIARLAKELEKKEKLKIAKEKRLLDQKKKRAELKQQSEARKKEADRKKQERIAKKRKEQQDRKLKADLKKREAEERKQKLISENKKKLEEKKIAKAQNKIQSKNTISQSEKRNIEKSINENLKIIYVNNSIVNHNLFPKINGDIEFVEKTNINKDYLDKLIEFNNNILVLIPRDFETSSVKTSENRMVSKIVIGIDQVPNPEINRIEAELRRAEQDYLIAERNFQRGTNAATNYNPYGGWSSVINQWAGLAEQAQAGKARKNARQRLESWSAKLSSTPMYLETERLGSYNYDVLVMKSEKISSYDILRYNEGNFYKKNLKINETKNFNVAYGLNPQDKNYKKLVAKYSTEEQVATWSNEKLKDLSTNLLKTKIQKDGDFEKLDSKKIAYRFLGQEVKESSFWSNLFNFGSKKKNEQTASLSSKSSFESKDDRFKSVVVVKTSSGMGSGFFVSKDEIITNYHVVEGAMSISIIDKNRKKSSAVIIKKDLKRDLALLKTNMSGVPVKFHSGSLKQGEMVEALGHPKGRKFSLTKGWISAIRKENSTYSISSIPDVLFIQTDAAINPGNSGGPLFFEDKVVGVNTQGLHKDKSEGMNFAVHFSEVKKFLTEK